jgi:hypothetical protein
VKERRGQDHLERSDAVGRVVAGTRAVDDEVNRDREPEQRRDAQEAPDVEFARRVSFGALRPHQAHRHGADEVEHVDAGPAAHEGEVDGVDL